ncbi:MAG: adenosylcobinamide-GDP ribazoletransferase [Oscillospiraceae bacterium]
MKLVRAFLMSFSMFCAIPCPIRFWDSDLRPLMTAVLPLVGLVIGAVWSLIASLCGYFAVPQLLAAAILTLTPWVLSGYIHLDGFMDSCDAILSRRDLEERRRILKDPLTGSFAVISLVSLAMISLGAFYEADYSNFLALLPVPAVTRACSAIAVQSLKPMGHSQYAKDKRPKYAVAIPAVLLAAGMALSVWLGGGAWLCSAAALLGWCAACLRGYRQLDGMSGDISGYAVTVGEACAAAAFAFI